MKTIKLNKPIEMRGKETGELLETIDTVTVRPLKMGDLLSAIDGAGGKENVGTILRHLTSRATRLNLSQIDNLELDDGLAITDAVESFLPNSLRTGSTPSTSSQGHSDTQQISKDGEPAA